MASAHDSTLAARHAAIDHRLAEEANRPLPDALTVAALKKQKLKLKEAMTR